MNVPDGATWAAAEHQRWQLVALVVTLVLLLVPCGCGRRAPVPTRPGEHLPPPLVTAVSPAPRSQIILDDPYEIWVEFAAPLDSTTVSPLNVFLMIDTRRIRIQVDWHSASRRIAVTPQGQLELGRAYTVELSPSLRSASGVPLGVAWSWQFLTNSLRHAVVPRPLVGAQGQSPFAMLEWAPGPTDPPVPISYEVFAGRESAAVAANSTPPLYRGTSLYWLPRTRWPQDATVYWAVTSVNPANGDRVPGRVWRFTAIAASARVDSLQVPPLFWNYSDDANVTQCGRPEILFGPGHNAGLVWDYPAVAPDGFRKNMRLAAARMVLAAAPGHEGALDSSGTSVWATTASWLCNGIRLGGPPYVVEAGGPLATGVHTASGQVRFMSDALTAHLEASIRKGALYGAGSGFYGYVLGASQVVHGASPTAADPGRAPTLTLYYYW